MSTVTSIWVEYGLLQCDIYQHILITGNGRQWIFEYKIVCILEACSYAYGYLAYVSPCRDAQHPVEE